MKGYFSIRLEDYEYLHFGKLQNDTGILGTIKDAVSGMSNIGRTIAHDVVEHSLSHRTNKYVSWEDEIRALGAASFVRDGEINNVRSDLGYMIEYTARSIKSVPYTIGKHLLDGNHIETDFIKELISMGVSPKNARNAVYQFAWGRLQKENYFKTHYEARHAFEFVEYNVKSAIECLRCNQDNSLGLSVYFDSYSGIFRWQHKRN